VTSIFNVCRWEWFKLQRKRMPWILLAILFGFSQLAIWGGFASYSMAAASGGRTFLPADAATPGVPRMVTCKQLEADPSTVIPADAPPQTLQALTQNCAAQRLTLATRYQSLSVAGGIAAALGVASVVGLILLGVLAASVVGSEFGLGTLRPILARGTGRLSYLAGKYLMLLGAGTVALLLVCAAAAGSGVLASHAAVPPPPGPQILTLSVASQSVVFLKTLGAMLAFTTMAGAITVLARSTTVGMSISLGYYIAEGLLVRLLTTAFDWFEAVADYLPIRSISALASARNGLPAALVGGNGISTQHAALVLAMYVIAFATIAALVFRRRDVVGASGG
jgi:ABC-type transport system involved in multi-copper enzyme maturation permease subunit